MIWARMLSYITGTVDQELLLRNEYLAAENRILRAKVKDRLLLSDSEKATLAEIAHRLGRKALADLWRPPRSRIRCSVGIESSSPKSSMARNSVKSAVDLESMRKSSVWWCEWLERTLAGDMIELWEP